MVQSTFTLIFFIFLFSCDAKSQLPRPKIVDGVLDLRSWDFEKDGMISLDGSWEFYWNELLNPKNVEERIQTKKSDPKFLPVPGQWQNLNFPVHGFATYRLVVQISNLAPDISISMKDAGTSYALFVDGRLASFNGKVGKTKSDSSPFYKYISTPISPLFRSTKNDVQGSSNYRDVEILIQVSNFYYSHSGLWNGIKIGSSKSIQEADGYKRNLDLIVFSSLLIMGMYHLGLYLNRRKDRSPLYFGIFCLLVALRTISINERMILDAIPILPFDVVHKFEYLTFYAGIIIFMLFVRSLYSEEFSGKWIAISLIVLIPCFAIVIIFPMAIYNETLVPVQILTVISILYTIYVLIRSVLNKRIGAKLFLLGWIAFALSIVNDILKNLGFLHTPTLTSYGLLTFIIFQASILSRKFAAAFNEIEKLASKLKKFSEELEDKVAERTNELQETLNKVQELKTQQDGDYFLTSLLLKPLNMNKAESQNVSIEFFSSQKKKFEFKKWKEEIGGDLSMSNSIFLKGRRYTVYINADAMGKSLQGAGGALVLGSVFESIVNRNQNGELAQDFYPENWIKESFLELHRVFETFDGSMLVSIVMGLIDDENGLYYMINAEHPWTILYRDSKASFITTESGYRKLGTLGALNSIKIFTYQLQAGDVLISGSDGRDDILLNSTNSEIEIINEDETLILKHIEKANADLSGIYEEILRTGIPIDDLTLVKVTYLNSKKDSIDTFPKEEVNSRNEIENIFQLNKKQFKKYLSLHDYESAYGLGLTFLESETIDTELMFQLAYVFKKNSRYDLACSIGERVKLRDPNHIRNLINLSDSYFLLGNQINAELLIDLVLKMEIDNKYALKRKQLFVRI
jgi:serine phosphatase RsbU (regulator of sigma subunit)